MLGVGGRDPHPCLPPSGGRRSYNRYYCQLEKGLVVDFSSECMYHKVLTYIEYRAVSGVFRTIDPPATQRVHVLPPHQRRRGTHSPGSEGVGGGGNISEDAKHWIELLQYNPSTICIMNQLLLNLNTHIITGFSIILTTCIRCANKSVFKFILVQAQIIIAIYAPMIYTAPCVMLLMGAASITRASGMGLVPGNRAFFGPCEASSR
jgi:hypothetical protein